MVFQLNERTYTATTSPYSTTLNDLGFDVLYNCNRTFASSRLTKLTSFPDTTNVTNMHSMFAYCNNSGLTELNLSSFNTINVIEVELMFHSCSSLQTLNVSSWDVEQITSYDFMLYGCSALTELIVKSGTESWWEARLTDAGILSNVTITSV